MPSKPSPFKTSAPRFSIIVSDCDQHTPRDAARRGVESLLGQTFEDFEVIFLHDGLKHAPYEVEFDLGRLPRFKTVYLKQRCADWGHTLRHYGSRIADGDFLLFFNIDNLLYPHCLEMVDQHIQKAGHAVEMVVFSIIHHANEERVLTGNPIRFRHVDCLQVIASRAAWESIGFWHRFEYEADGYLYVELSAKFQPLYVDEILAENF